jgi:hypothetical protein
VGCAWAPALRDRHTIGNDECVCPALRIVNVGGRFFAKSLLQSFLLRRFPDGPQILDRVYFRRRPAIVNPSVQTKTVSEFIAYAKADPGKLAA